MATTTGDLERDLEPSRSYARFWTLSVAIGVAFALTGTVALFTAAIAGVTTVIVLGVMLIATGLVEIYAALRRMHQRGFWRTLLAGALSVAVGVYMLAFPLRGLASVTLMIGAFFVVAGLFRTITAMLDRYTDWVWDLGYGVVVALLGTYVLSGWPASSLWALGTLVGIELLVRGLAWIGAGIAVRRALVRDRAPAHGRR